MIIDKFECVWYQLKLDNLDRGIVFFVPSRFTYAVFHGLLWYNKHNSNRSEQGNTLFPNLINFGKFFCIFSVYCRCSPTAHSKAQKEGFDIKQYYQLRNTLYTDISGGKTINYCDLKRFNYFTQGTLLHGASLTIIIITKFDDSINTILKKFYIVYNGGFNLFLQHTGGFDKLLTDPNHKDDFGIMDLNRQLCNFCLKR